MPIVNALLSAAIGFVTTPNVPLRLHDPYRAPVVVAIDPSAVSAIALSDPQLAVAAAVAVAAGAGAYAYSNKGESPSPPPSAPPAPKPVTSTPTKSKTWPLVGGSGGPHRMRGPYPKDAPREQWTPPPGWKPPSKPVLSWYDKGLRLSPPAPPPAPPAPPPAPPSQPPNFLADFFSKLQSGFSQPSASASAEPKQFPAVGGGGGPHRMRGPWPKAPAREQWIPPEGWTPPGKPAKPVVGAVMSWYDSGKRLT
uniref:Uncharacterized protein n=1 Tax=Haptolina brevifila TaxID=156173 RepID=A0A7S2J1D6_9EUKA